jgi:DNA-binding XRE family transcriptional regulator
MKIKIKETAKESKNWSLFKLAKELQLPHQTIYGWANGRTQPSFKNMDKLCKILECKIEDLFEAE